jgi:membrane protein YdbS with pleckstrin-like domain
MRRALAVLFATLALFASSGLVWSQEEILTWSVEPAAVDVPASGRSVARVRIENTSAREADDIDLVWAGPEGFSLDPAPASVAVLGPFASTIVEITVAAAASAPRGETRGNLEAIYTYCIDDLCYQIVAPIVLTLRVAAPTESTSSAASGAETTAEAPGRVPWSAVAFVAVVVLWLVATGLLWRRARYRLALHAALIIVGGVGLGFGVSLDQHKQAQAVGAVLCTSCVGIETVQTLVPRLSIEQAAAVERLTTPVDLLVFYAPWCRSCPYAEALVSLVAAHNGLVRYRLVNAEVERDLAAQHGVTRAGRTVVPAIVHLGTGKVLFGAEDLGDRLVSLLQEAP